MTTIAYKLRHRVTIEQHTLTQDPNTGEMLESWAPFAESVPAAIEYLSAREFIAAQAEKSEISARITIRYREDVTAQMRIRHQGRVYNIHGVLPDLHTARQYLTLPVSEGVRDG